MKYILKQPNKQLLTIIQAIEEEDARRQISENFKDWKIHMAIDDKIEPNLNAIRKTMIERGAF